MSLSNFVGNYNEVKILFNWLDDFYKNIHNSKHAIIVGSSGNGKTFLSELLAKEFDVELFRIHPYNVEDGNQLNNILKSINLDTLDNRKKLILVDDIDDFYYAYKKELYSIPKLSKYPVIFTSKDFGAVPSELRKGCLNGPRSKWYFHLQKPLTSLLHKFLLTQDIGNLSEKQVYKIAEQSKSVRSAVLTLKNKSVNTILDDKETIWDTINSIQRRELKKTLKDDNFRAIYKSIRGVKPGGTMKDLVAVMKRFAIFNYRIKVKYEEIDPMFVNNMEEPIEKVFMHYQFKKKTKKLKPKKVKEKPKQKEVVKKEVPLDIWGN